MRRPVAHFRRPQHPRTERHERMILRRLKPQKYRITNERTILRRQKLSQRKASERSNDSPSHSSQPFALSMRYLLLSHFQGPNIDGNLLRPGDLHRSRTSSFSPFPPPQPALRPSPLNKELPQGFRFHADRFAMAMQGARSRLASLLSHRLGRAAVSSNAVQQQQHRSLSSDSDEDKIITATLFPGDGIGPEIAVSVKQIFEAVKAPIQWEEHYVGSKVDERTGSFLTWESMESVRRNGIGLKGPMTTPIGKGFKSLNLTLRRELGLYANVRPCLSIPGYRTRYDNVDLVTIRENTEGEYSGLEHQVVSGVVESIKIITRQASMRVAKYAFHYAQLHGRKRVSAIHKANIMKKTDGLFLECCREVAAEYPDIVYEEVIIDNCCMMLVKNPALFDVLVMPNLYGDIISDLCAGLIGGLGLTPSGNIGDGGLALMEAVHGTAPDIAGKNMANPTALLLSSVMMLHHLNLSDYADKIHNAVLSTISEGRYLTSDLGGKSTTSDYTKALIDHL